MVQEANLRRASAERLLEESRMKSEMLAAEVMALKTLVLTSTPARPNPHLHPQIANGCTASHSVIFLFALFYSIFLVRDWKTLIFRPICG